MKTIGLMTGTLALSLLGTGCVATHKYVARTIAPVEQRVSATESKNADEDKQIAAQGTHLDEVDRDLSKTKEKVNDVDAKATKAGEDAKVADQKAVGAQTSADGAKQAANDAHTFAEQGLNQMGKTVEAMNKFHMLKTETILFGLNAASLTTDAKGQLDGLSKEVTSQDRYMVEVQGFTDKTGDPAYNETLSEERAQAVARYLANQSDIPVRSISILGSGYAKPVADDTTRDGRKMNRRVEVRIWVPDAQGSKTVASSAGGQ
jgi:outer membrane protein OmpA-like peptidoglycan-associated protein